MLIPVRRSKLFPLSENVVITVPEGGKILFTTGQVCCATIHDTCRSSQQPAIDIAEAIFGLGCSTVVHVGYTSITCPYRHAVTFRYPVLNFSV